MRKSFSRSHWPRIIHLDQQLLLCQLTLNSTLTLSLSLFFFLTHMECLCMFTPTNVCQWSVKKKEQPNTFVSGAIDFRFVPHKNRKYLHFVSSSAILNLILLNLTSSGHFNACPNYFLLHFLSILSAHLILCHSFCVCCKHRGRRKWRAQQKLTSYRENGVLKLAANSIRKRRSKRQSDNEFEKMSWRLCCRCHRP